ncbi:MAG: undecaprenyl-diphosphate phosphatase [Myxococcales bacterium]|nr:undecaprenyl-diphosphate phosphatase [Myxococcales bacterium]
MGCDVASNHVGRDTAPCMDLTHAAILGILEGLTEFIPVSSTGHLVLASHWLGGAQTGPAKQATDAFDIVIQAGAWLACVVHYLPLLRRRVADAMGREKDARARAQRLFTGLALAFVPIALIGKLFGKAIKAQLFHPGPVAVALAVGGVAMIGLDWLARRRATDRPLEDLRLRDAAAIGLAQCAALVPGMSRSMATLAGGMLCGLTPAAAADFSFLLAIPVLGAATGYETLKEWRVLWHGVGPAALAVGLGAAFVVGWAAIAGFLRVLGKVGLWPFGVYRIAVAVLVWQVLT